MIKNNCRILKKPHAHLQTILKTPVKFQKDRTKTVGGVKGTKYLLKIRNHAPRTTHHAPRKTKNSVPPLFFEKAGDNKVSCFSCTRHAYWSSSSSLPNIIKLSQTVWELWPAQDFSFRGDNYIMKTVRVVSLACDTPTGPPVLSYQILSKYVQGYQSYVAHKDASTD